MKNTFRKRVRHVQLVTAGKNKYVHYLAFQKKNTIIRYIEIAGVIAIAFIVIGAMTGYFD